MRCKDIQSLKEIYEKNGKEIVENQIPFMYERESVKVTPNRLKDMGNYIRTGKNPVHKGSKYGEIQWEFPSDKLDRKKSAAKKVK